MRIPKGEGIGLTYSVIWTGARILFGILFSIRVEGLEHVPASGPAIISPNHRTAWDPPVVSTLITRPLRHMAKAELFPWLGFVLHRIGTYPVRRQAVDMHAIRHSLTLLRAGRLICIFPEGTRNRSGQLGPAKSGAARLSVQTGAPVIPVGISGHYGLRQRVTFRFGPPVTLHDDDQDDKRIMDAIAGLIAGGPPTPPPLA
ncbi:MAG: lysophospholipid acyltransferase family protein [Sulfobacillus sp.]